MNIATEAHDYVTCFNNHSGTDTCIIINTTTGARTECKSFNLTSIGMNHAVAWISHNFHGKALTDAEGTNSGCSFVRSILTGEKISAVEKNRLARMPEIASKTV